MPSNQKGFGAIVVSLLVITLGIIAATGWVIYSSVHSTEVKSSVPLMVVTSSGGLCDGPCKDPVYNLYSDGTFQGYKRLSNSELSNLKAIINNTDFLRYAPNPHPKCASFSDGSDQVLKFPRKYGNKTFTPCMLDISPKDPSFTYINNLLETHFVK